MEYLTTKDELAAQTGGDYVEEADLPQNTREFFLEAEQVRKLLAEITAPLAPPPVLEPAPSTSSSETKGEEQAARKQQVHHEQLKQRKEQAETVHKILRGYREQPGLLDASLMLSMIATLFQSLASFAESPSSSNESSSVSAAGEGSFLGSRPRPPSRVGPHPLLRALRLLSLTTGLVSLTPSVHAADLACRGTPWVDVQRSLVGVVNGQQQPAELFDKHGGLLLDNPVVSSDPASCVLGHVSMRLLLPKALSRPELDLLTTVLAEIGWENSIRSGWPIFRLLRMGAKSLSDREAEALLVDHAVLLSESGGEQEQGEVSLQETEPTQHCRSLESDLCCNKVKRFSCSGSMNQAGIMEGGRGGGVGGVCSLVVGAVRLT